jgi:hypothetical protein
MKWVALHLWDGSRHGWGRCIGGGGRFQGIEFFLDLGERIFV